VKSDIEEYVSHELSLDRFDPIIESHWLWGSWIWAAGLPRNARALHRQRMLDRQIVVTEQMDLHLTWYESDAGTKLFIKPLPAWLLSHQFWLDNLCGHSTETPATYSIQSSASSPLSKEAIRAAKIRKRHASALGFLVSYSWLVGHPSDFYIAKEAHLLPEQVTYEKWSAFMFAFFEKFDVAKTPIAPRYRYGDLRLARLNAISRYVPHLWFQQPIRGFYYLHHTYSSFFSQRFRWITIRLFAYMAIVLTAMQVGLATDLANDKTFLKASKWFTIGSIILPLLLGVLVALLFVFYFLVNAIFAKIVERRRRKEIKNEEAKPSA
jgi:hypothetical protein